MGPRCGLLGAVVAFFVSSRVCVWVLREQCARGGGRAYKGVQGVPDPKAYFPNPKAYLSNRVWFGRAYAAYAGVRGRTLQHAWGTVCGGWVVGGGGEGGGGGGGAFFFFFFGGGVGLFFFFLGGGAVFFLGGGVLGGLLGRGWGGGWTASRLMLMMLAFRVSKVVM